MPEPEKSFDSEAFTKDSREVWNQSAPHYDAIGARLFGSGTRAFIEFAGLRAGWRILDVACGTGIASIEAAKAVGSSGRVLSADFSSEMLRFAQENVAKRERGGAPIELREMNAEAMDLPSSSFDAAICQLGLMLFAQPKKALIEMARVVKPGGLVACMVQGDPAKMIFTSLLNKTMVRHAPHLKIPGAPTIYDFAPAGVLDRALADAGLERVESRRLEGVFDFASVRDYWDMMAAGAGRTGQMLKSLAPEVRRKVEEEVFAKAEEFKTSRGIAIPYEFVMARGVKTV